VQSADRVIGSIEQAFLKLAKHPGIGHVREDLADRRHRFFLVFSCLVVYWVHGDALRIIRVLHSSRDVHALLNPHDEMDKPDI